MRGHLPRDRRLRLHVSALLLCLGQLIGCAAPRPRDDPAARAAWRAAQATEGEARVEALKALAVRWPDDLFAEQALGALSREARDPAALVPWLEARAAAPRQSAPMALYCVAWIHRHARGDAEAALAALARFTWPTHTLYDDALWMEAGLRAERGEGEAARAALRRIVEGRGARGLFLGSLRSRLADDALLFLADLHGREGRWSEASERYMELIERFTRSPLVPYAWWGRARAEAALGHAEAAEAALRRLRQGEGRLAARAREIHGPLPALSPRRAEDLRP